MFGEVEFVRSIPDEVDGVSVVREGLLLEGSDAVLGDRDLCDDVRPLLLLRELDALAVCQAALFGTEALWENGPLCDVRFAADREVAGGASGGGSWHALQAALGCLFG